MDLTQYIHDLLGRISLKDLVGKDVKLTKRGREYIGLCPFHSEKTPSFHVVEHKQFYHCFGCGKHGRAIEWAMEQWRYDFKEALLYLAPLAGMDPPIFNQQNTVSEEERAHQKSQQELYYAIIEAAAQYYNANLYSNAAGFVREYCASRQLDDAALQEFRIGYAGDGGLYQHLKQQFAGQEAHFEALGLVRQSTRGNGDYYDFFRHRLLFPIHDKIGRIIAFGGRYMGDAKLDNVGKYVNSPETPLFDKGRVMFNSHRAFAEKEGGDIIIVEGYMDAISLYNNDFKRVVAPLGTAISDTHLRQIWRYSSAPIMAFDGDNAGQKAAFRAAQKALPLLNSDKDIRFLFLPNKEDPDSFVQHKGKKAFQQLIDESLSLHNFLWQQEAQFLEKNNPQKIAKAQKNLTAYCTDIQDGILRNQYQQYFKNKLWQWQRASTYVKGGRKAPLQEQHKLPSLSNLKDIRKKAIIAILLLHPDLLNQFFDDVMAINFPKKLDKIYTKIHKLQVGIALDEYIEDTDIFDADLQQYYPNIKKGASIEEMALVLQTTIELLRSPYHNRKKGKFETAEEQYRYYSLYEKKIKLHQQRLSQSVEKG